MHRSLKYILSIAFLAIHLVNLTLLPIFTDETNYLDWGWREIHLPGYLFYSLYDAKQPLIMWLFGIFQSFIKDPLLAGRLVSVITGLFTATAVYFLAKKFFNQKTAILSFILYSTSHYFFFYNRQALMESGQAAIFTWTGYILFSQNKFTIKKVLLLGMFFGLGYLTKSNSLLVIGSSLLVLLIQHKKEIIDNFGISILKILLLFTVTVTILLPMLVHPWFGKYIHLSTQYTFTVTQLLSFPVAQWTKNILATSSILFWFITPVLLLSIVLGIIKSNKYLLAVWILIPLVLQIFMAKFLINRYLVTYLPLLVIFASFYILSLKKTLRIILLVLVIIPNLYLVSLQIFIPRDYFYQLSKVTKYSYIEAYVTGEPSGYNTLAALKYFDDLAKPQPILLGLAVFSGNPEASLLVYYRNNPNIDVTYVDAMLFGDSLKNVDCLKFARPAYLASRSPEAGGLLKYFEPLTEIRNRYSDAVLYVFKLKENCKGTTIDLSTNLPN